MDDQTLPTMSRCAIWEFFEGGPKSAKCRTCKMHLKTPTGTITALVNHLKRPPGTLKEFNKMCAAEGAKKTAGTKKSDGSVATSGPVKPMFKKGSQRAKTPTKETALFVATGLHSYSIVEEPGFLALVHVPVPQYQVPSRTTVSRSVVPALYAKETEHIKGELHDHFGSNDRQVDVEDGGRLHFDDVPPA